MDNETPVKTGIKDLDWGNREFIEDDKVSGSVVEFAFGPCDDCYIATSYPYRAEYAINDKRKVAMLNLPKDIWKKIELLEPRYIMNIAFRREPPGRESTWFMFCYRGKRFAYDSKWEPRKPSLKESIGRTLDEWKSEEKDQVSSCAFSQDKDRYFLRSTDAWGEWHPYLGSAKTDEPKLYNRFLRELRRTIPKKRYDGEEVTVTTLRAVTFGWRGSWVLYGKSEFFWNDDGMPQVLVKALKDGKKSKSKINKVVLNPYNRKEFVLVYDHGPVFCCFHPKFLSDFKTILKEWSRGMRSSGYFSEHEPIVEYQRPDQVEELVETANSEVISEDGDDLSPQQSKRRDTQSSNPLPPSPTSHRRQDSDRSQNARPAIPSQPPISYVEPTDFASPNSSGNISGSMSLRSNEPPYSSTIDTPPLTTKPDMREFSGARSSGRDMRARNIGEHGSTYSGQLPEPVQSEVSRRVIDSRFVQAPRNVDRAGNHSHMPTEARKKQSRVEALKVVFRGDKS